MVSSFVRSGERIDVAQFLKGLVQMPTDDVLRREGFALSSAEQESRCPVANELFEKSSNRRVEVNLAKDICCFEPWFKPAVMNFLLDKDGEGSPEKCACQSRCQAPRR